MHDFLLKELSNTNIEQELINIGFDKTYTHKAKDKFEYKNFKIRNEIYNEDKRYGYDNVWANQFKIIDIIKDLFIY